MDIFSPKRPKIVATLVVRDEEDILEAMLAHTLEEGVDCIFATDNNSRDRTRRILERCPGVVDLASSDDMTHNQEAHTTRMARQACKLAPDWIVHLDADEFWCGLGDIRGDYVERTLWCPYAFVHPPVPGIVSNHAPLDRMRRYLDFHGHAREFKVIHRPDPHIRLKHGNHGVEGHRMGVCGEVSRHHYPIRGYAQFHRKVWQGAPALKLRNFVCERWCLWYDEAQRGNLEGIYDLMAAGWEEFRAGDEPPEGMVREVLQEGYKVMPDTIREIFDGLRGSGQRAVVGEWVPGTYRAKRLF